jgi:SAM-dependent methyltransferase
MMGAKVLIFNGKQHVTRSVQSTPERGAENTDFSDQHFKTYWILIELTETSNKAVKYWSARASDFVGSTVESGARHPKPLSRLIHKIEFFSVLDVVPLSGSETMIDIGSGIGRWAISFAPCVKKIVACEPSELFSLLKSNTTKFQNIEVRKIGFEDISENEIFDIAIISGVSMYLSNQEAQALIEKASDLLKEGGTLILREPVSSRGLTRINSSWLKGDCPLDVSRCEYWEFIRKESFYLKTCQTYGCSRLHSFVSHAPFFYYIPKWIPFSSSIKKTILYLAAKEALWGAIRTYNRTVRGLYRFITDVIGRTTYRIYILQKSTRI